jgi:hypothetical protein
MSKDLDCISVLMYLGEGQQPANENKRLRLEKKISEWKRDVVLPKQSSPGFVLPSKQDMASDFFQMEWEHTAYWCEGEECYCKRTHWVVFSKDSFCYECMHDPCACRPPLFWDESEDAYFRLFESCDATISRKIWLEEPSSTLEKNKYCRQEKKRKEQEAREMEEAECNENQQAAQQLGFCCHNHAVLKKKEKTERKQRKKAKIDGPHHCIFCDEDPCAFVQIESRLGENDDIYYDADEFEKDPVACNRARRNRAYKYAAYILWERVGYRRQHYKCVENGVRSLYPPFDGKITGFKEK